MAFPLSWRDTAAVSISGDRTNLWLRSQEFDSASWPKTRCTVTANSVVAPDGTLTGDTVVEDATAAADHFISQSNLTSGLVHTLSVCAKAANRSWIYIQIGGTAMYYNIAAGTMGAVPAGFYPTMQALGNGWYRISLTGNASSTGALLGIATGDGIFAFNGLSQDSFYLWGAQQERSYYTSAYIPTAGATASGPGSRSRLIGCYAVGGAAASSLQLKNKNSSGTTYVNIDIPAGAGIGTPSFVANEGGVVFPDGIYLDITGTPTGVTVIYEK